MTDTDSTGLGSREEPAAGRRLRRLPIHQKCRIVEETFVPGASVSIVARRHDLNANLLFDWRNKYRQGILVDRKAARGAASAAPELLRIGVVDDANGVRPPEPVSRHAALPAPSVPEVASPRPAGIIEIELPSGIKVRECRCGH